MNGRDRVFVGKLTRKLPIRRPRRRTKEDGIKYSEFIYLRIDTWLF